MKDPRRRPAVPVTFSTLLVAVMLLLGGCVSVPVEGPVVEGGVVDPEDTRQASDIDARPPPAGASRIEVVTGFLDAMTAWPIQTNVAKKYLTEDAAAGWNPEQETVVYSDALPARETGGTVDVELTGAESLDAAGGWRGAVVGEELSMSFRVSVEDGEYRIADPRDALVVPASWFQQRYRQVSLYYFDPIAQILVPEPVFVPQGEQLATTLVSSLLAGPPPRARGIVRTFLPPGLSVGLSVPVSEAGVAQIDLVGDAPRVTAEEAGLLLAQLAWTLRQDSSITAIRVRIGGVDLPIPGGASLYRVDAAEDFNPAGNEATTLLFGVSRGQLVWGSVDNLVQATGPFGVEGAGLEAVAARPDAEDVAVVDSDGRRVRIGPVRADPEGLDVPRTVLSGGSYARPTWDVAGRLWVLERRAAGARVWLVEDEEVREVAVPGVSGTLAQALAVSRDGTRLIGVVRTSAGDEVVGARVQINDRGRVERVRTPFLVRAAEGTRVDSVEWTSPIRIGVLTPTAPGSLYEVDVVAADGASFGVDVLSTIVNGLVIGLAASPSTDTSMYAVYADRYVDLVDQESHPADGLVLTQLDYAG